MKSRTVTPPPPYYIEKKSDFHPPLQLWVASVRLEKGEDFSRFYLCLSLFLRDIPGGKEKGKVET